MQVFFKIVLVCFFLPFSLFSQTEVEVEFPNILFVDNYITQSAIENSGPDILNNDFKFIFNNYDAKKDQNIKIKILVPKSLEISTSGIQLEGKEVKNPKQKLYEFSVTEELLQKTDSIVSFKVIPTEPGSVNFVCLVKSDQNENIFYTESSLMMRGIPNLELLVEKEPIHLQLNEVSIQKILISSTGTSTSTNAKIKVIGSKNIEPHKTVLNKSTVKENTLVTELVPILQPSSIKNYLVSFQALKKGIWTVYVELTYDQCKDKKVKELVFIVE